MCIVFFFLRKYIPYLTISPSSFIWDGMGWDRIGLDWIRLGRGLSWSWGGWGWVGNTALDLNHGRKKKKKKKKKNH